LTDYYGGDFLFARTGAPLRDSKNRFLALRGEGRFLRKPGLAKGQRKQRKDGLTDTMISKMEGFLDTVHLGSNQTPVEEVRELERICAIKFGNGGHRKITRNVVVVFPWQRWGSGFQICPRCLRKGRAFGLNR